MVVLFFLSCNSNQKETIKILLAEDENIVIYLHHYEVADLGDSDWLKIEFRNKTNSQIKEVSTEYSINNYKEEINGKPQINIGTYGSGNEADLIHFYIDLPNANDQKAVATIEPKKSMYAWKFITNYASVLLDNRKLISNEIEALMYLSFEYKIKENEYLLRCDNKQFKFKWTNSDNIIESKLENRLREIVLNPHYRWVNSYVAKDLMNKENIVSKISSEELIQGIVLRNNVMSHEENKLFFLELKKRNKIPNNKITTSFKERIKNKTNDVTRELSYYWDNALIDDLINFSPKSKSLFVSNAFELNSKAWKQDTILKNKVYQYLLKSTNFDTEQELKKDKIKNWADNVKRISIARCNKFNLYLETFLDDETEFIIEDWSKFRGRSALRKGESPDSILVKVCDVAFVALLRNLDQFESTDYYKMEIKNDVLSKEIIDKIIKNGFLRNINLQYFEKHIKLTTELKNVIRRQIAIANNR